MFLILASLVLACSATIAYIKPYYDLDDAPNLFNHFVRKYNKVYYPEEYFRRLDIFMDNLREINERNAMFPQTVFAVNHFADMTLEEIRSRGKSFPSLNIDIDDEEVMKLKLSANAISAPDQFDWRDYGVVTPVKDQGGCGACWIFSAIGNIEGQYAIKHKQCLAFSEQQSIDCMGALSPDRQMCEGGLPHEIMTYHQLGTGVQLEEDYGPYVEHQSSKCRENPALVVTNVTSFHVYKPTEDSLERMLYETGPLSVALDDADFTFYSQGILFPRACTNVNMTHGMLLVGYGIENETKYWILKNSHGTSMGEDGYVRLLRGRNACGMGTLYTATCIVA